MCIWIYIDAVLIDIKKNLGIMCYYVCKCRQLLSNAYSLSVGLNRRQYLIMYFYFIWLEIISERRLLKNLTNQLRMRYPGTKRLGAQTTLLPGHRWLAGIRGWPGICRDTCSYSSPWAASDRWGTTRHLANPQNKAHLVKKSGDSFICLLDINTNLLRVERTWLCF